MDADRSKRSGATIFVRILALFLSVNLAIGGALLFNSYRFSRETIEKRTEQQITQQIAIIRDNFDNDYLIDLRRSLKGLATSPLLDEYLLSSSAMRRVSQRKIEKLFQSATRNFEAYHGVSFVDWDGNVEIEVAGNKAVHRDLNLRTDAPSTPALAAASRLFQRVESIPLLLSSGNMEWFMPPREVQVEGPYIDEDGVPGFTAAYAKLDLDTGMFGGVVLLRVRLDSYFDYLRDVLFFDHNPIWVLDRHNQVLQQPRDMDTTFDPRPYLGTGLQTSSNLQRVARGVVDYQDFTIKPGEPFIRLAVSIPSSVLLRDLEPAIKFFSLVLLGSVVVVLIVSLYVSNYLARPIRKLAAAATSLARGDLSARVEVRTTGEVQTLVQSFNRMAEDLTTSTAAREATLASLETEVAERKKAEHELKQQAAELSRARTEAERAARVKSEFLATMSHEIRTPINGMLGMTELLLHTELDERQLRFARTAHSSGQALLHVINDILDYSKIEAGKLELNETPFDVRGLIEELGEVFAAIAHRKGVELLCAVAPDADVRATGDAGRLRQVLTNLLGNAVKFTESGEIVLRVVCERREMRHATLRFEVQDTGIGIAPEAHEAVFESFSQADSSTTRKHGGTGLGLAISRRLVALMGGRMDLVSEVGRGSTFGFGVRLATAADTDSDADSDITPRDTARLHACRALIVDENHTRRGIVAELLGQWGCVAELADDGVQGLARLREAAGTQRFDLAVFDQRLPEPGGLQFARAVRDDPALAKTGLIMLSSVNDTVIEHPGADEIRQLTKPVRQSALYDCLLTVLGETRARTTRDAAPGAGTPSLGGSFLVVEDNIINQELTVTMLEVMGGRADVAGNGRVALESLRGNRYDAILMDCQMPDMDGFETTCEIRRRERCGELHGRNLIVALTADALPGDEQRCLDAGMDAYLPKPFSIDDLGSVLSAHLLTTQPAPADRVEDHADVRAGPRAEAGGADAAVLDRTVLDSLRSLQRRGQDNVLSRILGSYLKRAPELLEALGAAVASNDAERIRAAAHSFKGCSANVGAVKLAQVCSALELQCRNDDLSGAHELLQKIEIEHANACAALDRERSAA